MNDLLVRNDGEQEILRVVWIDAENEYCYLKNVYNSALPKPFLINDVLDQLKAKELRKTDQDPFLKMVGEDELTEKEKKKRDQAFEIIDDVYHTPKIFMKNLRRKLIRQTSERFKVSEKTVLNHLIRYWQRGMTKSALLPDFKSEKKSFPRQYHKKVGRPNQHPSSIKRSNVTDDWKKIFQSSLEKYYYHRKKPTLKYAYQQMIKEYFSIEDEQSGYKILDVNQPIPSFDQFYYWYRKWNQHEYKVRKREGTHKFLQNHRAIIGSSTKDAMGVGVYAVDATIGDIYLVSSIERQRIIGRPIIYLIVDIFSRCIVGLSVSIENMSSETLRMAFANMIERKKDYCKRVLDIEIGEDEWPIHYVPSTILADRGSELLSDKLSQLVEDLHIKIQNVGAYRAELKGVCEQYFNILQNHLKPFLPASVYKDVNERGSQDYRKSAVLNLKEYTSILIRCVLYYNNHHFMTQYPLTPSMKTDGIQPIPIQIFHWGLRKKSGTLRKLTLDQIRGMVYPQAQAKVTAKGLLFNSLYYSSSVAIQEKWFSKARQFGSWKVEVHYDPYNVGEIYLRHGRHNFETCPLIEQYQSFKRASQDEIHLFENGKRQEAKSYEEDMLNGQIKLAQDIESIVQNAKRSDRHINQPKLVENIQANRQNERKLRKNNPYLNKQNLTSYQQKEGNNKVRNIEVLRQKQKEGFYDEQD